MTKRIDNLFFLFLIIGVLFIPISSESVTIRIYGSEGLTLYGLCPDPSSRLCAEIIFSASHSDEFIIQNVETDRKYFIISKELLIIRDAETGQPYLVILEKPLSPDVEKLMGIDLKINKVIPLKK